MHAYLISNIQISLLRVSFENSSGASGKRLARVGACFLCRMQLHRESSTADDDSDAKGNGAIAFSTFHSRRLSSQRRPNFHGAMKIK